MSVAVIWGTVKTLAKSLNVWGLVMLAALVAAIYWGSILKAERKAAKAKIDADAASAAATVTAATETAKAAQEAEASTPLPADKAAILELCRRSASCRERGQR